MPTGAVYPNGYASGHVDPVTHVVIMLLSSWFRAIEDGSVVHRMPDWDYERPGGKTLWTEEQLDALFTAIDEDVTKEVRTAPGMKMQATDGPGFCRMDLPQRLALAQQLEQVLEGKTL